MRLYLVELGLFHYSLEEQEEQQEQQEQQEQRKEEVVVEEEVHITNKVRSECSR